jgi:hypothetical protein
LQSFVCTATVRAAVGGQVLFTWGGFEPVSCALSDVINGVAVSCPISTVFAGSPTIVAFFYGADGSTLASAPYTEVVNAAAQNVTFTLNPVADIDPSTLGQTVTFVANIVQLSPIVAPGPITGTVVFTSDGAVIDTVGVVNNQATTQTANLGVGLHSLVASYHGDANNLPSISGVWIQQVNDPAAAAPSKGKGKGKGH